MEGCEGLKESRDMSRIEDALDGLSKEQDGLGNSIAQHAAVYVLALEKSDEPTTKAAMRAACEARGIEI